MSKKFEEKVLSELRILSALYHDIAVKQAHILCETRCIDCYKKLHKKEEGER